MTIHIGKIDYWPPFDGVSWLQGGYKQNTCCSSLLLLDLWKSVRLILECDSEIFTREVEMFFCIEISLGNYEAKKWDHAVKFNLKALTSYILRRVLLKSNRWWLVRHTRKNPSTIHRGRSPKLLNTIGCFTTNRKKTSGNVGEWHCSNYRKGYGEFLLGELRACLYEGSQLVQAGWPFTEISANAQFL